MLVRGLRVDRLSARFVSALSKDPVDKMRNEDDKAYDYGDDRRHQHVEGGQGSNRW